jgi:RIO kinase 1
MSRAAHTRCAKVYRDMRQRSFQKRAQYQEGRKVRGSRQARAIAKSTRFGRKEQEAAWKNAEVDALYKLVAAGVRVPKPYGYFDDTLIMELVTDAAGPLPRGLGRSIFHPGPRASTTASSSSRSCAC